MDRLNLNQEVSSQLSLLLVLVLSFAVAWYTIKKGDEVINNAKNSQTFNFNKIELENLKK